ncbi:MAG: NAD(P)/FAD-dependent oxidoreductase [Candidatus Electrothrix sp. GW3-4]|uniref:phytoene desaturase family protein n=1 Tax=Candidatus Electrothrix sp. GW3-4 TaxID=3126740 RepID=UPI0030D0B13E
MLSKKKILIIGSGIGGLSTAIILTKLGFEATVLEKNRQTGGLMRSYPRDGIECEVGVHYLGSLDKGEILRKFFDYLGVTESIPVTRMGQGGVIDRYLFAASGKGRQLEEPAVFDVPEGLDAFAENLQQAFPEEREAIAEILARLHKASEQLHGLDFLYGMESNFTLLDQADSLGEILNELHCSPRLRSILAVPSCWIGVPLQDCPAFYHNMALASYLSSSWRLDCSGSDMADVFAQRLLELGGKIITRAEVSRLEIADRVVKGVRLQSGEYLPAETVIGAVHPKVVLQMLPEGAVKPSYRQRISRLRDTHGIFSVHVRVDAESHPEIPYNIFKIDTDEEGNVPDMKYYQIRTTDRKETNLLSILTSGKDELWAPWLETSTGRRGKEYGAVKAQHAEDLLKEAEGLFGAFKGAKILDAYTPLTMRDWVNSPGGSAYGVQRSSSQMLAAALLNRTAVKGLYLAGQNVLAPGVIGTLMGSFSTVKLLVGAEAFKEGCCLNA